MSPDADADGDSRGRTTHPREAEFEAIVEDLWWQFESLRQERGSPSKAEVIRTAKLTKVVYDWLDRKNVVPDWPPFAALVRALDDEPGSWNPRWTFARSAYDDLKSFRAKRIRSEAAGLAPPEEEEDQSESEPLPLGNYEGMLGGDAARGEVECEPIVGPLNAGEADTRQVNEPKPLAKQTSTRKNVMAASSSRSSSRWYAIAAGSVLGIATLVLVALIGGDSHQVAGPTESTTSEQRAESLRMKREQIYLEYLAAAGALAEATDAYVFQCPNATRTALEAFNCSGFHSFGPHYNRYEQADAAMRIYWSPTVKQAAEALVHLLPTVNGHFEDGRLHNIDRNRFESAKEDLRKEMCTDIQIDSSQACE